MNIHELEGKARRDMVQTLIDQYRPQVQGIQFQLTDSQRQEYREYLDGKIEKRKVLLRHVDVEEPFNQMQIVHTGHYQNLRNQL